MSKRYKWGILGPGNISGQFSKGLQLLDNAVLYAVGSRDIERARLFSEEFGFEKYYGSYEELVTDTELDIVYIASPHSHHHRHAMLCLEHGKHIICEKALAHNEKEAREMFSLANDRGLFMMEALWPPFQPSYIKADEIIRSGIAGNILHIDSLFAFQGPFDPANRLYNPELAGGSLLDIGIYPVMDILRYLGEPDKIRSNPVLASTGVDESISALFSYKSGQTASMYSSFKTHAGVKTHFYCENGNIKLERRKDETQSVRLELSDGKIEEYTYKPDARGYHFEASEVMRCLDKGMKRSETVSEEFSLKLIRTLDRIRADAGIVYPCEK
jgi:predicted dehydrogenase